MLKEAYFAYKLVRLLYMANLLKQYIFKQHTHYLSK